jgi:ankyrin repeat protein
MREHGNKGSNALFLAEFDQKLGALPTFQSPRSEIEKHITLKYKEKKWMKKIQGDLNLKLFEACKTRNWIEALECIFQGANVNFQNLEEEGRTILHEAVNKVDVVMSVLLIENGAALDLLEERGWNPLHYAAYRDCAPLVELLLLHRSPLNAIDQWGFDPLNLAMKYESNSVIELLNKAVKKADVKNQGTALSALRNSGNAEAEQAVNNERAIDGALKGITEGRKTKIEKFFTGIFKKDKE